MPRQSRIDTPGALHHIICRGIDRQQIFSDDSDRDHFVSRLGGILIDTSTRCFAWALIPNHFHLLLQTGATPISTVMRRLLTGHAVSFNRRHRRHGHLFQNRYKSILCQEDSYFLELVRYIHLNPLRAGVVGSLDGLEHFAYCGHRQILGRNPQSWMATDEILSRFGKRMSTARKEYVSYVSEGMEQGDRLDLTGGGLVRSYGGWQQIKLTTEAGVFLKSDERILGDSHFVAAVLGAAEERLERRDDYARQGIDLDTLVRIVAKLLEVEINDILVGGKQPKRVRARSLLCFWAVRELGLTGTNLAGILHLTQPAVSIAVQRGERLAREYGWRLEP
jgi:putative transposase